jgi:hypothetical protein
MEYRTRLSSKFSEMSRKAHKPCSQCTDTKKILQDMMTLLHFVSSGFEKLISLNLLYSVC